MFLDTTKVKMPSKTVGPLYHSKQEIARKKALQFLAFEHAVHDKAPTPLPSNTMAEEEMANHSDQKLATLERDQETLIVGCLRKLWCSLLTGVNAKQGARVLFCNLVM